MLRNIEIPEHINNIEVIRAIHAISDKFIKKLVDDIEKLEKNIHISTSTIEGIERRERILGINPLDKDTIPERRYRVLLKWFDTYPYTMIDLDNRLNRLCGKDQYRLDIDMITKHAKCSLELTSQKMESEIKKLLDEILPNDLSLEVVLRYRQWQFYKKMTWGDLGGHTYNYWRTWVQEADTLLF